MSFEFKGKVWTSDITWASLPHVSMFFKATDVAFSIHLFYNVRYLDCKRGNMFF